MKKFLIIFLIIIVLAALAVGGLFAFKGKKMPLINKVVTIPWVEKTAGQLVSATFNQVESIKSGHLALSMSVTTKTETEEIEEKGNTNTVSENTNGYQIEDIGEDLDLGEADLVSSLFGDTKLNISFGYDFQIGEQGESSLGKLDFTGALNISGMNYEVDLESITTPEKIYLRASKLPPIPGFELSNYLNQWFYYDIADLAKDLPTVEPLTAEEQNNLNQWKDLFTRAYGEASFIEISERLPDESISGVNCYHEKLIIDKEKFNQFMTKSFDIAAQMGNTNSAMNTNISEMKNIINSYEPLIDKLNENYGLEIWVGKNDLIPYKAAATFTNNELPSVSYEISISVVLSNINQTVSVETPQATKSLDQIWQELTNSALDTSFINSNSNINTNSSISENLAKDSDNDGLTDMEEIIYGTDSQNPDSDGDGYKDGAEVDNGYNPLGPGKLDSDNDGLPDTEEEKYGTDKYNPDTDEDGYKDGAEVLNGYNPLGAGKLLSL